MTAVVLTTGFAMPLSVPGAPFDKPDILSPGVEGYAIERDGVLLIPLVMATDEGAGDIGRFLDALPRDRFIRFPCVISGRLAGMLERRGFVPFVLDDPDFGAVEGLERQAT